MVDHTTIMEKRTASLLTGILFWIFAFVAIPTTPLWAGNIDQARQLYQRTQYKAALQALGAEDAQDARVLLLAGQIYYQLGENENALERLEKAAQLERSSAEISLWLGRSLGQRAKTASYVNPLKLKYAIRCREALERAVELDAKNVEAMSNLASYYLKAPESLGGSLEKAKKLAAQIAALDPVREQYVQARIATREQHFSTAEGYLQQVATITPNAPALLFTRAELYIQEKHNLEEARALLRRYLQMPLTPEDPPRWEAELLLKEADS